ncbi:MAG: EAL domain-containing protein [Caulobacteraceae bacterium]
MDHDTQNLTPGSPEWETERLRDLRRLDFLYADRQAELERLCQLSRQLLATDVAAISLVDYETVHFLSATRGLERRPRANSFGDYAIRQDGLVELNEIAGDPRFTPANPVQFYAGVPIALRPGLNVGVLAVSSFTARKFTPEERANLRAMADLVLDQIRLYLSTEDARRREALMTQASKLAQMGAWELDLGSDSIILSDEAHAIVGLDPAETVEVEMLIRQVAGEEREQLRTAFGDLRRDGAGFDFEIELAASDDQVRWVRVMGRADQRDGRVVRAYGAIQDISLRKSADRRIHHLAHHDGLTGLANRALFNEKLAEALAAATETNSLVGVGLVDFDHFKMINDTKGHAAGDRLLQVSAERLRDAVGRHGAAARLGGDEFAILLTGFEDTDSIIAFCERTAELLQEPIPFGAEMLGASASLGVTIFPDDHRDASELLKNADIALYLAKSARRGRPAYFMPKLREQFEDRLALMKDVRRGIAEGEFELHYQPICNITAGQDAKVAGFEALMRWRHPEKGLLSPAAFQVAFEEVDLAAQLGDVSLLQVIDRIARWKKDRVDFGYISLNVNQAQFASGSFFAQIADEVRSGVIPAEKLIIEVTESVYLSSNPDRIAQQLGELHDMGVRIALDDFGTGYASLTHLKQFPIDVLKVDRSFIQRIGVDPDNTAITMAVINLGKALGMDVVAEGVESREQSALLSLCGCNHMQGFYYAKALQPDAVPDYIRDLDGENATSQAVVRRR